jgi:hypothetical protein
VEREYELKTDIERLWMSGRVCDLLLRREYEIGARDSGEQMTRFEKGHY